MGTPLGPKYIPYTYMDPLGFIDSSAALGICNRKGVGGRVKHMATRLFWLQEMVLLYAI